VNQNGQQSIIRRPTRDGQVKSRSISDMASAACPACNILSSRRHRIDRGSRHLGEHGRRASVPGHPRQLRRWPRRSEATSDSQYYTHAGVGSSPARAMAPTARRIRRLESGHQRRGTALTTYDEPRAWAEKVWFTNSTEARSWCSMPRHQAVVPDPDRMQHQEGDGRSLGVADPPPASRL